MKHLFIGGVADGQWLEADDREEIRIPKPGKLGAYLEDQEDTWMSHDTYRRQIWRDGANEYTTLYVLKGFGCPRAALIENYRPGVVLNGLLRRDTMTNEEHRAINDYLSRGGRVDKAIAIGPNISQEEAG